MSYFKKLRDILPQLTMNGLTIQDQENYRKLADSLDQFVTLSPSKQQVQDLIRALTLTDKTIPQYRRFPRNKDGSFNFSAIDTRLHEQLAAGCDPNDVDVVAPILTYYLVAKNSVAVELLLKAGADPKISEEYQRRYLAHDQDVPNKNALAALLKNKDAECLTHLTCPELTVHQQSEIFSTKLIRKNGRCTPVKKVYIHNSVRMKVIFDEHLRKRNAYTPVLNEETTHVILNASYFQGSCEANFILNCVLIRAVVVDAAWLFESLELGTFLEPYDYEHAFECRSIFTGDATNRVAAQQRANGVSPLFYGCRFIFERSDDPTISLQFWRRLIELGGGMFYVNTTYSMFDIVKRVQFNNYAAPHAIPIALNTFIVVQNEEAMEEARSQVVDTSRPEIDFIHLEAIANMVTNYCVCWDFDIPRRQALDFTSNME